MKIITLFLAVAGLGIVANGFYHCDKHFPRSFQYTIMAPVGSLLVAVSVYFFTRYS